MSITSELIFLENRIHSNTRTSEDTVLFKQMIDNFCKKVIDYVTNLKYKLTNYDDEIEKYQTIYQKYLVNHNQIHQQMVKIEEGHIRSCRDEKIQLKKIIIIKDGCKTLLGDLSIKIEEINKDNVNINGKIDMANRKLLEINNNIKISNDVKTQNTIYKDRLNEYIELDSQIDILEKEVKIDTQRKNKYDTILASIEKQVQQLYRSKPKKSIIVKSNKLDITNIKTQITETENYINSYNVSKYNIDTSLLEKYQQDIVMYNSKLTETNNKIGILRKIDLPNRTVQGLRNKKSLDVLDKERRELIENKTNILDKKTKLLNEQSVQVAEYERERYLMIKNHNEKLDELRQNLDKIECDEREVKTRECNKEFNLEIMVQTLKELKINKSEHMSKLDKLALDITTKKNKLQNLVVTKTKLFNDINLVKNEYGDINLLNMERAILGEKSKYESILLENIGTRNTLDLLALKIDLENYISNLELQILNLEEKIYFYEQPIFIEKMSIDRIKIDEKHETELGKILDIIFDIKTRKKTIKKNIDQLQIYYSIIKNK